MHALLFNNWREGIQKITLTHVLRDGAGMTLSQAKMAVDGLLEGNCFLVRSDDAGRLAELKNSAEALGAACEVIEYDEA